MRSRNNRHGPAANQLDLLSFRAAFRLVRFVFGEGPGGLGLNFSTSERFSRIFPPIDNVVKRPFPTKRAIAWRVTLRISAASACETHRAGSKVFLGEPLASKSKMVVRHCQVSLSNGSLSTRSLSR